MKHILFTLLLAVPLFTQAQSKMYITTDLEGGLLDGSYESKTPNISDAIIDENSSHYNIKASVGFLMEFDNSLSATLGFSQSMRFWSLEGQKSNNTLKVTNRQNYSTIYLGGYYQFPINSSKTLNIYGGTKMSLDFINYNALNKKKGVKKDYVDVYTEDSNTIEFNVVPEIGVKGYFSSGNFWKISCRYNLPIHRNIVQGTINHHLNKQIVETINYSSAGRFLAVGLTYGFALD